MPNSQLTRKLNQLIQNTPTVTTSVTILNNNTPIYNHNHTLKHNTASMGKIFILLHLSKLITNKTINPNQLISIQPEDKVKDSGILQHLSPNQLTYNDLATLISACSDNTATNTLIRTLGLTNIQKEATLLNLAQTNILDYIRDERNPNIHPHAPSQATTQEYAQLIQHIANHQQQETHHRVTSWLTLNQDLSMVAAPFNLDPLSHNPNHLHFYNKTGTDNGVRCDAGNLTLNNHNITYTVFTKFNETTDKANTYTLMHNIGQTIIDLASI